MFKLDLEKAEEPRIKFPTSIGTLKKQESSRKTSTSALLITLKPLTVWITVNCGKFWKRWAYQATWSASWEICMQVRKQQLKLDMKQQTGSKSGKKYVKAVYCHCDYLTYMQSTSWETLGWRKHKLEWILPGEKNNLRYAYDTTLMAESEEELKASWWTWKRSVKKLALSQDLSSTFRKLRSWHPVPSLHGK